MERASWLKPFCLSRPSDTKVLTNSDQKNNPPRSPWAGEDAELFKKLHDGIWFRPSFRHRRRRRRRHASVAAAAARFGDASFLKAF